MRFLSLVLGFLFVPAIVFAENITLTTYYPAPSGAYKALRSHGLCVGAACTHALIADNNLSVQGRIGIGTTAPSFALQVGTGVPTKGLPAGSVDSVFIKGSLEFDGSIFGDGSQLANVVAVPAGANKEVQYNNAGATAGNGNFVFDQGTNRVGIGSTNPQATLDVQGSGVTVATSALIVRNSLSTPAFVVRDNGKVGIGSTSPQFMMDVQEETLGTAVSAVTRFGNSNAGAGNILRSARGTRAAPSAVLSGDDIACWGARGYRTTGFPLTVSAGVQATATENFTDSATGTRLSFETTANGTTVRQKRMYVDHNGNVGIGIALPTQRLDVAGQVHASGDICTDAGGGKCLSTAGGGGAGVCKTLCNIGGGCNKDVPQYSGWLDCETYFPGTVVRGVWQTFNGASYYVQGVRCCPR